MTLLATDLNVSQGPKDGENEKNTLKIESSAQQTRHLGLIKGIFKHYKILEKIDKLLPKKSNNQNIPHSYAILAMVYMGMGFTQRKLYESTEFFKNLPVDKLFDPTVHYTHINDDVLAAALDAIKKYGPTKFFVDLSFGILTENNLFTKFIHMDTSTFDFYGSKYDKKSNVKICFGKSKSKKNLAQLVQCLVTTDEGLPFWMESASGNETDTKLFQDILKKVQVFLKELDEPLGYGVVADAAVYSKKFLLNKNLTGNWVSRVPESINLAKELVEFPHKEHEWVKINNEIKYTEYERTYGKVKQRWILVNHRVSRHKELKTLKDKIDKQEKLLETRCSNFKKKVFKTTEALNLEAARIKKSYPHFSIHFTPIGEYNGKKQIEKNRIGWKAFYRIERNKESITKLENKKGKFIIATNILDDSVTNEELIKVYTGRTGSIERGFRFMKDRSMSLDNICLKK